VTTRFSRDGVTEVSRRFFGTLRNVAAFFATYANVDGWLPPGAPPPLAERPVLDRWILSRLDAVSAGMREDLRNYQITRAARALSSFVLDELSNWYVRRCRRRFWKGEKGPDKEAAYATLHEVLVTVARLLAPIAPFLAETLHRGLAAAYDEGAGESVHLTSYPAPGSTRRDERLEAGMTRAMALTELARAARSQAGLKVRLPLPSLRVLGGAPLDEDLLEVVRDEINVKQVDFTTAEEVLEYSLKPSFKVLGPRFGGEVNRVAAAIRAVTSSEAKAGLPRGLWTVRPEGMDPVEITKEEVEIASGAPSDMVFLEDGDLRVALVTRVDPELEREGKVRELVHRLQNLRKERGLLVTDRVALRLGAAPAWQGALTAFEEYIRSEVLAEALRIGTPEPGDEVWDVDGEAVSVRLEKTVP
jgi:isoleucyl-tRNA synthetase